MVDDAEMDDGIVFVALYHDTPEGQEQECYFRDTVDLLLNNPTVEEMRADPNFLVVIPASDDFLGIFQGKVELTLTFKPFAECTLDDADRIRNAHINYGALSRVEAELYSSLGDVPEDDKTLPPHDYEERIQKFRAGVREEVDKWIALLKTDLDFEHGK